MNFLKRVLGWFSVVKADVNKVRPEVQSQIDKILNAARVEADRLIASHSVQTFIADAEAEIAKVQNTANQHIKLIEAARDAKVASAQAILPPLVLPPV